MLGLSLMPAFSFRRRQRFDAAALPTLAMRHIYRDEYFSMHSADDIIRETIYAIFFCCYYLSMSQQ